VEEFDGKICDPSFGTLEEAIRQARLRNRARPGFDLDLNEFLHVCCAAAQPDLGVILRGLEVLERITEESRLFSVLRPFLKSTEPRIASKAILLLGRRFRNMNWIRNVLSENDDRIRANLVEALWRCREGEIDTILKSATGDRHPRVAANAIYGLYLLGSADYQDGLDRLIANGDPRFRRAALWVIRSIGSPDKAEMVKPLIRDPDPGVRRAAFAALGHLRSRAL
jgi:HEAT repeat protein